MLKYGIELNTRKKVKINSSYIKDLERYFRSKGFGSKSKSFAIATSKRHSKEGKPTFASSRFSKNKKRVGFIQDTASKKIPLDDIVDEYLDMKFQMIVNKNKNIII